MRVYDLRDNYTKLVNYIKLTTLKFSDINS